MEDLTEGSIARHLTKLAAPIAIGMVFQTLYYLVDLYFVAQLGEAAIAGLTSAGNVQFLVMALTQVLGVGTMALIAHASGRKDQEDANLIFNQSLLLAALCAAVTLTAGYALAGWYMNTLAADAATATAGRVHGRVRQTLRTAVLAGSAMMLVLTLLCQVRPELLIGGFTDDTLVISLGADFLRIISWNFVAVGIIFTCSSMFQALGNTIPALLSSASRLLTFALPTIWLSSRPGFELAHVWYLSVGATTLQAITSGWLLRQELRRRLGQD